MARERGDREERPEEAPEPEAEVVWFVRDPDAEIHTALERFRVEGMRPIKLQRRQALELLVREALEARGFLPRSQK
jgi:hypothetical protein